MVCLPGGRINVVARSPDPGLGGFDPTLQCKLVTTKTSQFPSSCVNLPGPANRMNFTFI